MHQNMREINIKINEIMKNKWNQYSTAHSLTHFYWESTLNLQMWNLCAYVCVWVCVCVCVWLCLTVYLSVCLFVCLSGWVCLCLSVYTSGYLYDFICVCVFECECSLLVWVCVCVCLSVCVSLYVCVLWLWYQISVFLSSQSYLECQLRNYIYLHHKLCPLKIHRLGAILDKILNFVIPKSEIPIVR